MLRPGMALAFVTLLAALAAAPSASAARLDARLQVAGDVVFSGAADAELGWVGSFLADRPDGPRGPLAPFGFAGTARQLNFTFAEVERGASNPLGYSHDTALVAQETWDLGEVQGQFRATQLTDQASLLLLPDAATPVHAAGDFAMTPWQDVAASWARTREGPDTGAQVRGPPSGSLLRSGTWDVPGVFEGQAVATGLVLQSDGGAGDLDARWTDGSHDLAGVASSGVSVMRVVVLDGAFRLPGPLAAPAWTTVVRSVHGTLDGDLFLQNAEGEGTVNGTPLAPGTHMFQANGPMVVDGAYDGPAGAWTVSGQPTFVAVNALALVGARWGPGAQVAAAAGLVALLLAVLTKAGRAALEGIAGLHRTRPMAHPKRREMLALVARTPGVNQRQLADLAAVPRGTARHHLSILTRSGLLQERTLGGLRTYTLNSGSFDFAVAASGASAATALASARQPARARILAALQARGESDYQAMAEHWRRAGEAPLAQSLATYHCKKLVRSGLLRRRVHGGRALWSLAVREEGLLVHQRRAFLTKAGLAPIWDALRQEPMDERQVLDRLGPAAGRRRLRENLQVLEATGLARRDEHGRFEAVGVA